MDVLKMERQNKGVCYVITFNPHHSFLFVLIGHFKLLDDLCNVLRCDIGHLRTKKKKHAKETDDFTLSCVAICQPTQKTVMLAVQSRWETICEALCVRLKMCIKLNE